MRKWQRWLFAFMVLVIASVITFWSLSKLYPEICQGGAQRGNDNCSGYEVAFTFGRWINSFSPAIQIATAIVTAAFTVVLAKVGRLQVRVYARQAALMKKQARLMEAGNTAVYRANTEMLNRMESQLELARAEFNATHRPRLRIRDVAVDWGNGINKPPHIYYVIRNIGETTATSIELKGDIIYKIGDRWIAPIGKHLDRIETTSTRDLDSGSQREFFIDEPSIDGQIVIGMIKNGTTTGKQTMCVTGRVTYRSKAGVAYCTCFLREYDLGQNIFIASKNPEENYED